MGRGRTRKFFLFPSAGFSPLPPHYSTLNWTLQWLPNSIPEQETNHLGSKYIVGACCIASTIQRSEERKQTQCFHTTCFCPNCSLKLKFSCAPMCLANSCTSLRINSWCLLDSARRNQSLLPLCKHTIVTFLPLYVRYLFSNCSPLSRSFLKGGLNSVVLSVQHRRGSEVFFLLSFPWKSLQFNDIGQRNPILHTAFSSSSTLLLSGPGLPQTHLPPTPTHF